MNMTSNKPYLIRAMYDWIVDNNLTPYLLVNTEYSGAYVPATHVKDKRIVLNISPQACRGLHLDNHRIVFTARFSGHAEQISLIPNAIMAIYAKENGKGMEFDMEAATPQPPDPAAPPTNKSKGKPVLTLVKQK